MSETPVKKKRAFFSRFVPSSVAGKAAWATALVLLLMLLAVWVVRIFGPQRVALVHAMTPWRMLTEFTLVLAIPPVLYWGIRRWNQVIEGAFPDIDQAWQAGVKALEAQGIRVADYPLFLILGSSRRETEEALVNALESNCRLHGIPHEAGLRHALQWYASPEAIYLFCPGTSSLSALLAQSVPSAAPKVDRNPVPVRPLGPMAVQAIPPAPANRPAPQPLKIEAPAAAERPPKKPPAQPYLGTLQLDSITSKPTAQVQPSAAKLPAAPIAAQQIAPSSKASPAAGAGPYYFGTLSTDHLTAPSSPTPPKPTARVDSVEPQSLRAATIASESSREAPALGATTARALQATAPGSVTQGNMAIGTQPAGGATTTANSAPAGTQPAPRMSTGKLALPSALDTSDQLARLRYTCLLLRRIRRPHCGINGILTLLPFELSGAGPLYLSALAQSLRGDVNVIQETLGIRSPLSAMLIGLEQDKGFNELVRRLQPELLSRRLGGRFDIRSRPTPEALNNHSDLLCDAFEDWVYRLFGREEALAQQRGNRKLYELISRIRHELKPRLRIVLGEAFGCEPESSADNSLGDNAFFFSGCYFAASGAATGQPAFVKGVLHDKLIAEQSQVEWTVATLRTQRLFRGFAIAGWIVAIGLAILLLIRWLL